MRSASHGRQELLHAVCAVPYPYDTTGSQRYRWEQWAPFLSADGIHLDFLSFCTPDLGRALRSNAVGKFVRLAALRYPSWISQLHHARSADIVIVPRKSAPAGPVLQELYAASGTATFVYDFDDAVFLEPEGARSRIRAWLDPSSRCARLCRKASLVTAGNEFLADFARQHADEVVVIPTTVNTQVHAPRSEPKGPEAPLVVGWSGSPSTSKYLRSILPQIRKAQELARFELLVVGDTIDLEGVSGRCVAWTSEAEVPLLQEMDIGLMPLHDTDWERGKCSLKAILYGAVGIPSIVSNVGTNPDVVLDGETGFVLGTDGWTEAICRLVADRELRGLLGMAARRHIQQNYDSRVWTPRLAEALRRTVSRKVAGV